MVFVCDLHVCSFCACSRFIFCLFSPFWYFKGPWVNQEMSFTSNWKENHHGRRPQMCIWQASPFNGTKGKLKTNGNRLMFSVLMYISVVIFSRIEIGVEGKVLNISTVRNLTAGVMVINLTLDQNILLQCN